MAKRQRKTPLFQRDLVNEALRQSFIKLNPKILIKNPVMFTVEVHRGNACCLCWILGGEKSREVSLTTFPSSLYFC
jgi:K+-transporting ATPase ATPase B chain